MSDMQILGICSALLSILAAMLCAQRLHNWRHPILFVGVFSLLMMPAIAAKKSNPSPTRGGIDVGELWLTEFKRIRNGKATELPTGMREGTIQAAQIGEKDL